MATTNTRAVIDLVINGSSAQTTMRQVSNGVRALRRELLDMAQADNPALYAQRSRELTRMLATQRQMRAEVNGTASDWQKISGQIGTITAGLLGGNIISAIPAQFSAATRKIVEYRDSLSDVSKTTGMSKDEVVALNEELKKIDTRTATADLRKMAATAGQFGIAKKDIEDFTKSADILNVALGDQFGGAEATAETIVKLRNTFTDIKTANVGEDMLHIGNAINVLEAAGAATAPVMADFASRIGGVAIPMKMTTPEVLALSATLQELNVTAERGGSAITDILMGMAKAPEAFAEYARNADGSRISTEKFTFMVNNHLMDALKAVAMGLGAGGATATTFAARLDDMGIKGNGATEVLMKLGSNTDLLNTKIATVIPTVNDAKSVLGEFAAKNDQLARDLKSLDEGFENLYTSQAVQDFVGSAVHNAVQFSKALVEGIRWLGQHTTALGTFILAMAALNGQLILATLRTGYQTAAVIAQKVAYEVGFRWLVLVESATAAYNTIMAATTIRTRIATAAQLALNWALNANPIGAVIALVYALATALKWFSDHSERALKVQREANILHQQAAKIQKEHAAEQAKLNERLNRWNELSVTERNELEKTMTSRRASLKLKLLELQAKVKENALNAAQPSLYQDAKAMVLAGGNLAQFTIERAKQTGENIRVVNDSFKDELAGLQQEAADYDASLTKIAELRNKKTVTGGGNAGGGEGKKDGKKKAGPKEDPFRVAMNAEFGAEKDNSLTDYEKESMAFAQRFTKLYVLAGTNLEKIKEVDKQNMAAWAIVEANEKKRQDEFNAKKKEKDDKEEYGKALTELVSLDGEKTHETKMKAAMGTLSGDTKLASLQQEEQFLTAKLLLQKKYNQDFEATNAELTQNCQQQDERRAESSQESAEAIKEARKKQVESDKQLYAEGIEALAGFVSENTVAYKALIVAAKAFAIAEIIINTQRQISQIWADPKFMLLGFGGIGAQIAATALASARAAGSIAQLSGLAGREEGGYTGVDDLYVDKSGQPGGYVNKPTLFALGQRSYIAGEGSKQEYVIPYPMLKKPAVANTVAMLEAMRTGRAYAKGGSTAMAGNGGIGSSLSTATAGGGSGDYSEAILHELRANRAELQQNRITLEAYANRPIVNDYLAQERQQQWVQHIRSEVGVS